MASGSRSRSCTLQAVRMPLAVRALHATHRPRSSQTPAVPQVSLPCQARQRPSLQLLLLPRPTLASLMPNTDSQTSQQPSIGATAEAFPSRRRGPAIGRLQAAAATARPPVAWHHRS